MTKSTVEYLKEKSRLLDHIQWYEKNIPILEAQQDERKKRLSDFKEELYQLEKDYYDN